MNIGEHLRKLRSDREYTLKQVSERCGLSVSYLSDLELGRTQPSLKSVEKLANGYGVSMDELLGGMSFELSPKEIELVEAYREGLLVEVMRLMIEQVDALNEIPF